MSGFYGPDAYEYEEPQFCSVCGGPMVESSPAGFNRKTGKPLRNLMCNVIATATSFGSNLMGHNYARENQDGRWEIKYRR